MNCIKLLAGLVVKLGIVGHVEEVKLPGRGIEIIHIYEKGEEPSKEKREMIRERFRKSSSQSSHPSQRKGEKNE